MESYNIMPYKKINRRDTKNSITISSKKQAYKDEIRDPRWQRKRLEIMNRDDFRCQLCKTSSNHLNVHHLYYLPKYKIWEYDNEAYVTLCESCHLFAHTELLKITGLISMSILKKGIDFLSLEQIINSL